MSAQLPDFTTRYTELEFDTLGFHDCRITGIEWNEAAFELTLSIQYILKWLPPTDETNYYSFWISPTRLTFYNVEDPKVMLQWQCRALDCIIQDLVRRDSRSTPKGVLTHHWEFELFAPDGLISLWATGFELMILQPPVLCDAPRLR